ncbi:MAG: glyoxalase [Pelagibacterium sp. SCN 64-44]|nr:MAG: glyoxalase [Pelagibacterium sp. SCN 64-44]
MTSDQAALRGKATELFAGVPVRDLDVSLPWYEKLLGASPAFYPNESEAVWALADHRWLYLIVDPARAGGTIQTIICDDLEVLIADIEARGLSFQREERPAEGVRKVMYDDPDGNEIGLGRVPAA